VSKDKAKVLATPRLMTLDNEEANIEIITRYPYEEASESTDGGTATGTSYVDVGTRLSVTPHITNDGHVSLTLRPSHQTVAAEPEGTDAPRIDSRQAQTKVMVRDGETAVIAGLRRLDKTLSQAKLPILGDIPFFGALFRTKTYSNQDTELMIFVTPHIIKDTTMTLAESAKFYQSQPGPHGGYGDVPYLAPKEYGLRPPKKR
jgi:type II secretory pathway component GspD/PulD (secretin)